MRYGQSHELAGRADRLLKIAFDNRLFLPAPPLIEAIFIDIALYLIAAVTHFTIFRAD